MQRSTSPGGAVAFFDGENGETIVTDDNIVRAWKDRRYRASLAATDNATLPAHPAGLSPLGIDQLGQAAGGATMDLFTIGCCTGLTEAPWLCTIAASILMTPVCTTWTNLCTQVSINVCGGS